MAFGEQFTVNFYNADALKLCRQNLEVAEDYEVLSRPELL